MTKLDDIKKQITDILLTYLPFPVAITESSNLYFDLGFDSLMFVYFLVEIESKFNIDIDLLQMQEFLVVGNLIDYIKIKLEKNV